MDSLLIRRFDILQCSKTASGFAALLVGLAGAPARLSAQCTPPCPPECLQVEGGPFVEAWVDSSTGCDPDPITCPSTEKISGPGLVSIDVAKAHPFKTISEAMAFVHEAVILQMDPASSPGIVHLEPGIYTEALPVIMRPFVHLQ